MTKPRPCRVEGCDLPKAPPAHSCIYHHLMRQPIEVQVAAARAREAAVPATDRLPRLHASAWAPGTRWCASCQSLAPLFYFPTGGSQCRACNSARTHAASIKRDFDLTAEEYDALLLLQDGKCAICRQKPVSKRLAVDHDHSTGGVRGLLCTGERGCNRGILGSAHDSLGMLKSAVAYMEHPPMSGEWKEPPPPKAPRAKRAADPAELDPSYLMHDHEAPDRPLPHVLEQVAKRMTADQLVFSGGRSDPKTGTYWLAYRRQADEVPPWEMNEAPRGLGE